MNNKTAIIITGDEKGGVRAIKATKNELGRFNNQQKETQRGSAELQRKIGSLVGKLTIFSGATTAATGLISGFGLSIRTEAIKEVEYLSQALGISTSELTEWGYAAETLGFSTQKLADIFKDVQDKVGDFAATGGGEAKDVFEQLELSIESFKGLKPDEQLLAIASALEKVGTRSEKIFFLESIANDASRLLPLLEDNGKELRKLKAEAQQFGVSLSDADAQKVKEVSDSFHRLGGFVEGTTNQLTLAFAPAIEKITDDLVNSLVEINGLLQSMDTEEMKKFVSLMGSIAGGAAVYSVLKRFNVDLLAMGAAVGAGAKSLKNHYKELNKTTIQTNAHGQVLQKTTKKMKLATLGVRGLGAALKGALGPIGLAITAGYALYDAFSSDEIEQSTESVSELADELERISKGSDEFKLISGNTKELDEVSEKVILLSKTVAIVEKGMENMARIDPSSKEYKDAAAGFVTLQLELQSAQNRQKELMESSNNAASSFYGFASSVDESSKNLKSNNDLTLAQKKSFDTLLNTLNPLRKSLEKYDKDLGILNAALNKGKIEFGEYLILVEQLNQKFNKIELPKESPFNRYYDDLAALDQMLKDGMDFSSYLSAVEQLNAEFNNIKLPELELQDPSVFDEIIEKIDEFGGAWSNAGSVIIETFGSIADVLDDYVSQLSAIDKIEKETNKLRQSHGEDHAGYIEATQKLEEARVKANLSGVRGLTGAAATMFKENSKAREALHRLEMGFMLAEMAMSIEKTLLNATEAVTNQGSGDPYTAPARIASMIGIMAGVLGAVGIAFGGSSSGGFSVEERQENQGTGTVFGDSSAKSESINSSFERMLDLEADQYAELVKMNSNMRSLNSAITGVVESLVRGRDFDNSYSGFLGTVSNTDTNGLFEKIGGGLLGGIGGTVGGLIDSIIGGISKTSYKLKDSGIQIAAQNLSDILNNGLSAVYYNTIERTKKRLWGLSKSSRTYDEYEQIDNAILSQLTDIFGLISDTALSAAESLQFDSELLQKRLESINLGLTTISFTGLSGDEIQAELEAVLSATSDQIALQLVPELKNWQKIGEGAYETLTRVATEQAIFNQVLEQTGQSLNVLGNVASIDIAQNIIELAGGIEQLRDAASVYFSEFFTEAEQFEYLEKQLTAQFDNLGFTLPRTKDAFKELIKSLDLTTESGQQMYAALLNLSPALAEFLKQLKDGVADATDAILEQVTSLSDSLNKQLDDAFGKQARVNSLNTLISKERSLYDQRYRMYERELRLQTALGDLRNNLLLGDLSTLSPEEKLTEARRQLDAVTLENSESVISNYLSAARLMYGAGEGYSQAFDHAMSVLSDLQNVVLVEPNDNYIKSLEAERDALLASIDAEKSMQQLESLFEQMMELGELDSDALKEMLEGLGDTPAVFEMLHAVIYKLYQDTGAFDDIELTNLNELIEAAFGLEQLDLSTLTDTELNAHIDAIAKNMSALTGIDTTTMTEWINNILQLDDPDLTASLLELVNTKNQLDIPEAQLERLNNLVGVIDELELTDASALDVLSAAITGLVDNADVQFLRLQNMIDKIAEINIQPPKIIITDPPLIDIGRPIGQPVFGDLNGLPIPDPEPPKVITDPIEPWTRPIGGPVVPPINFGDFDPDDFKFQDPKRLPNEVDKNMLEQMKKLEESNNRIASAIAKQTQSQTQQHAEAQLTNSEIATNTRRKLPSGRFESARL